MASPRTSIPKARAFTLIEVLVVLALVAMVLAMGLAFSFDDYRSFAFRSERDTVVNVLQKARSQAESNICYGTCTDGKPHGVYFGTAGQYVIFQGDDYATRDGAFDEVIASKDQAASVAGMSEARFNRLRADAVVTGGSTLTVTQGSSVSVITIEPEGRIWWTN